MASTISYCELHRLLTLLLDMPFIPVFNLSPTFIAHFSYRYYSHTTYFALSIAITTMVYMRAFIPPSARVRSQVLICC